MHVVFVIHDTNPLCGASKAVSFIIDALRKQGDKATVVVPNTKGLFDYFKDKGIDIIVASYKSGIYPPLNSLKDWILFLPTLLRRRYHNIIAIKHTYGLLKNQEVDIVHSNSSVIDIGYFLAKRLGCFHLYHIREFVNDYLGVSYYPNNNTFIKRIQAKDKYSYTACIIPELQHLFMLERSSFSRVVYDGVLPKSVQMLHPAKEGYFLYVGRIEKQKGFLQLLEAYIVYLKTSPQKLPLKVLGSVNERSYYKKIIELIQENNIEDKIEFCGMQEDVHSYMKHANAIVISSLSEGFGFCMAEAMFNECPVIGYDVTGTHQQFENGLRLKGTEIGFRYMNKNELITAFLRVEEDDNDRMVKNAWETVNSLYTREQNVESLYDYYKYIINE